MFSATHSLKGLSCLNSPGTPQRHSADLRRQQNFAEKSVIAAISCVEQRSFKIPQLPALREVVSESAQQKRRFFLLLFLSSSANSQNEAQTRSKRVGVRMAAALSGKRAHSGSHGQTGAIFSSFCLSANRPPKVGPGFRPDLRPAYSRTRCLPCPAYWAGCSAFGRNTTKAFRWHSTARQTAMAFLPGFHSCTCRI